MDRIAVDLYVFTANERLPHFSQGVYLLFGGTIGRRQADDASLDIVGSLEPATKGFEAIVFPTSGEHIYMATTTSTLARLTFDEYGRLICAFSVSGNFSSRPISKTGACLLKGMAQLNNAIDYTMVAPTTDELASTPPTERPTLPAPAHPNLQRRSIPTIPPLGNVRGLNTLLMELETPFVEREPIGTPDGDIDPFPGPSISPELESLIFGPIDPSLGNNGAKTIRPPAFPADAAE